MTRHGGLDAPEVVDHRPLYARVLRLKVVAPSGFLCFVFLEGAVALGILLALAELVSWWGVLVLPATVAIMVKLNDVIAGSLMAASAAAVPSSSGLGAAARAGFSSAGASPSPSDGSAGDRASVLRPGGMTREATGSGLTAGDGWPATLIGEDTTARLPGMIDRGYGDPVKRPWAERAEAQQQWLRQSATRRYE